MNSPLVHARAHPWVTVGAVAAVAVLAVVPVVLDGHPGWMAIDAILLVGVFWAAQAFYDDLHARTFRPQTFQVTAEQPELPSLGRQPYPWPRHDRTPAAEPAQAMREVA